MTPEQFKISWERQPGDTLVRFSEVALTRFKLTHETARFLAYAGLPDSAAPFLDFVQKEGGEYNSICRLIEIYDFLEPDFYNYIFIGSDGNGNPIVINTNENDKIELLDHENMFSAHYVNSSIAALGGCLIAQRDFIQTILSENGEDACLKSDFTDTQFEKFKNDIEMADPQCLSINSFWKNCLDGELMMREYHRSSQARRF